MLDLPERDEKPRDRGLTMVIDTGLPTRQFEDLVGSFADLIDVVKLGWCTALVTRDLDRKLAAVRDAGVDFYFGGTLFEKYVSQGRFDEWRRFIEGHDCHLVEVSNGSIPMSNTEKAGYVAKLAGEFTVFSEVGYKDSMRSEAMPARDWINFIREDLAAGAHHVITEARESGKSGICSPNGQVKADLVDQIARSGLDLDRLLFEAPTKDLQLHLIRRIGPQVNLGNIAAADVVSLETLRRGLRGDTLLEFDEIVESEVRYA